MKAVILWGGMRPRYDRLLGFCLKCYTPWHWITGILLKLASLFPALSFPLAWNSSSFLGWRLCWFREIPLTTHMDIHVYAPCMHALVCVWRGLFNQSSVCRRVCHLFFCVVLSSRRSHSSRLNQTWMSPRIAYCGLKCWCTLIHSASVEGDVWLETLMEVKLVLNSRLTQGAHLASPMAFSNPSMAGKCYSNSLSYTGWRRNIQVDFAHCDDQVGLSISQPVRVERIHFTMSWK